MYFQANSGPRSLPPYSVWPRRRRLLGDDASILNQVFQGQAGAPAEPRVRQTVQQAMAQGMLFTSENCSGITTPASAIVSAGLTAGGGVALKLAPTTGPAAPFVLAAAGILQLFGAIFGHHAAKVKQEQQIICAVVQSVNDSLAAIDQLVQTQQITPAQGGQALDALYSQLQQQVQPILKQDSSHCNAACYILAEARGVIGKRKEQYSKILPPQASAACAQKYWDLYPDVAGNKDFGRTAGPDAAWTHYSNWGQSEGRTWPCDAAGGPLTSSSQAGATDVTSAVGKLAASTGLPVWALWGLGGLLLLKVLR